MTRALFVTRWSRTCLGTLLLTLATHGASAASPKRVLMVFREDSHVPATVMLEQAVREKLRDPGADGIEIYTEYLDTSRFADESHHRLFREYLREKFAQRRPDVILTVLTPAFDIAGAGPGELIPGVPAVFIAVNDTALPGQSLGANVSGIVARPDYRGTLEVIFRLQPETRRVVLVGGVWAADRSVSTQQVQWATRGFTHRAEFEFWTNRPMAELRSAVAALPAGSVVLYSGIFRDAADRAFVPAQALELLLESACVPTYVLVDSQLGSGAVGGSILSYDSLGAWAGETARRILDGATAAGPPITVLTNGTPIFDWHALRRWGIRQALLPPGSVVRYQHPTFWELYRWPIAGTILFCLLQAALIIGLLVNRAKRRQAEAEASLIADISSKFVNLPVSEVDREIRDAQRRICELLGLDLSAVWQWSDQTPGFLTLTHFYSAQGSPQPPKPMDASKCFPWYQQQVLAGRIVAVGSLEELPAEAAPDRESARQLGIKSNLTIPFSVGGEPPLGALGLNTTRAEHNWPDPLVKRLQLVAQIFTNALARKRADQALRESEELNRATFEQAAVGIAHVGTDGRWLRVNERLCAIVGYQRDELMKLTFQDITHPDDLETDLNFLRQVLSGEIKTYSVEKRCIRKDRSTVWVILTVSLVRTAAGTPTHLISVVEDITERKRAEEAMRNLSRRLIRAHEEERARLARDLHDDVTQRLARLAIDAGRVERGADGVSQAETMRSVRDGLVSLSEDVHSLSYRLHPSVLEDLGLAEALKAECERFSRQESLATELDLGELPSFIPPDTALCLFRVAQEALRNVARHAQARRVEVSVRAQDGGLQLAVLDDGMGFEPALQRDRPSLGLASMRERVLLLDGELNIESAPGMGTTILVWVPIEKAEG